MVAMATSPPSRRATSAPQAEITTVVLAKVFPHGTAKHEINRRKDERLRRGEEDGRAQASVIEELTGELIDGRGLGVILRKSEADAADGDSEMSR